MSLSILSVNNLLYIFMLFLTFSLFFNEYLNNEIEGHFTGSDNIIQEWLDKKDMGTDTVCLPTREADNR